MTRINASEVREDFAEILNRVAYRGERIVVHRRGKDVVALVPVDDVALLQALEDRIDLDEARKAHSEAKTKGTVRWEALKTELGL